ncbi:YdhK family protein [Nosocomiicoccus ampullae]|uniref:YdhK family protein n=1 Tax=Nosocomiicoccus ampullae TaxID=489910 RepID=UPI003B82D693
MEGINMVKNKILLGFLSIFAVFLMAACGNGETQPNEDEESQSTETESSSEEEMESDSEGHMEHSAGEMSSSGEVPEDLKEAENPTYAVGSQAIIEAEHMQGMDGAEATIYGAFDTTVYTVSYTPTNGEELVENHKWVIHEELEEPGEDPLEPGDEAVMNASHMEGMEGATATIDSAEKTTVYMVDFVTTDTEEEVHNHKWVTESELTPIE